MAGIGFELKKLFNKKGVFSNTKAVLYSSAVTIGPTIACIGIMIIFNIILKNNGLELVKREIFQATIMYSFVFSLILTSGYSMVLTRYISDKICEEKYEDIKASLYGSLAMIVLIGSLVGIAFYRNSPMNIEYKFLGYILFIELIIEIILCTYVTAVKNYKIVVYAFVIGLLTSFIVGIGLIYLTDVDMLLAALISFDLGILILIMILYYEVQRHFNKESNKYFEFLRYFKEYYLLFLINTGYLMGVYIHNFIFWANEDISTTLVNTYVYCPTYDIPAFFALITTLATNIMFSVKLETSFFEKYRNYFYNINGGASYKDIEISRNEMESVLKKELSQIMIIQLIITVAFIFVGRNLLLGFGFTSIMIDEFNTLTLAFYGIAMIFVLITILLYFDDRKGACLIALSFFITNAGFTYITSLLGNVYYGFGTFVSATLVMIIAMARVRHYIKNIDYFVFCKNSKWTK
jgi:uncharacterized membrane protein